MANAASLNTRATGTAPVDLLDQVEQRMRHLTAADESDVTARACRHHLDSGGGRTRAKLALSMGQALALDTRQSVALATAAELLHNASLIHDDIQDASPERRARPSLWRTYGAEIALTVGDLFISAAYAALSDPNLEPRRDLINCIHRATQRTIRGQNQELSNSREQLPLPQYERIVSAKSGPLLSLPAELVLLAAGHDELTDCLREGMAHVATTYQILDDLEDVEVDRAGSESDQRPCLNIVVLLETQNATRPREEAVALARLRLDEASAQFDKLPSRCSKSLRPLIERLRLMLGQQ